VASASTQNDLPYDAAFMNACCFAMSNSAAAAATHECIASFIAALTTRQQRWTERERA